MALWAGAGDIRVLGDLHWNLGQQVNDFPSALGPTTGQLSSAVGTLFHHMLHPLGGRHPGASKAVSARLVWFLGLGRFPVSFGLQTRHPLGTAGFGRPFQLGNPFLQPFDDLRLPDDDGNQDIPVGGPQVHFPIHSKYMT